MLERDYRKRGRNFIFFFFLLFPSLFLQGQTINGNGDFQIWLSSSANTLLNKKLRAFLDGEVRFGNNGSELYVGYVQTRFHYTVRDWLELSPGYRQQFNLILPDRVWRPIFVTLFDVLNYFDIHKWSFIVRNRFQYNFNALPHSVWIYRFRIRVDAPYTFGKMKCRPIAADEIFVQEGIGFFENRLVAGVRFNIGKRNITKPAFVFRLRRFGDEWRTAYIFSTRADFNF